MRKMQALQQRTEATMHAIRTARAFSDARNREGRGRVPRRHDYVASNLDNGRPHGAEQRYNRSPMDAESRRPSRNTVVIYPTNDIEGPRQSRRKRREVGALSWPVLCGRA